MHGGEIVEAGPSDQIVDGAGTPIHEGTCGSRTRGPSCESRGKGTQVENQGQANGR